MAGFWFQKAMEREGRGKMRLRLEILYTQPSDRSLLKIAVK